ncbi:MAG: dimethyl sulfoxide reductase anchor subunit [Bacteroidetes bacterium]|nr:dimethyl sulfoxide reductase anchor subunit [Bacteroidota bacterium]
MHNGEWSLISFTLLSQLSVGLVLALGFVYFMHQSLFSGFTAGLSLRSPELIILILIVFATLISFLHLGSPLHSYHSLNNLRGSWISREILTLFMFGFGILLFLISRSMDWPVSLSRFFMIFSMISGILLVLAMSGIYMIKTVPSWNTFFTPLSFIGSAFLLSSVGMIMLINFLNSDSMGQTFLSNIFLFMLIVVIIILFASGYHHYQLSRYKFTGIEQMEYNHGVFFILFVIRMVLLLIAMFGLIYLIKIISRPGMSFEEFKLIFYVISFIILSAEVIGRYQFYISYFRVGV